MTSGDNMHAERLRLLYGKDPDINPELRAAFDMTGDLVASIAADLREFIRIASAADGELQRDPFNMPRALEVTRTLRDHLTTTLTAAGRVRDEVIEPMLAGAQKHAAKDPSRDQWTR